MESALPQIDDEGKAKKSMANTNVLLSKAETHNKNEKETETNSIFSRQIFQTAEATLIFEWANGLLFGNCPNRIESCLYSVVCSFKWFLVFVLRYYRLTNGFYIDIRMLSASVRGFITQTQKIDRCKSRGRENGLTKRQKKIAKDEQLSTTHKTILKEKPHSEGMISNG